MNKQLNNFLPKSGKYYYEKTEISEIAPRPATLTYDLLDLIYSSNGPIAQTYKKYRINYQDTKFLKIIGNELFVDKEKEIKGLLPSYSYFANNNFNPKLTNYSGIITTIKNLYYLNRIKTGGYQTIFENIKKKIENTVTNNGDLKNNLENFLKDYKLIFETNLLSGITTKKLEYLLKKEAVNFSQIIAEQTFFIDLKKYQIQPPTNLIGNSLELTDESTFTTYNNLSVNNDFEIKNWWQTIPQYKKKLLLPRIKEVIIYNQLREFGRWLTLKNINILKTTLLKKAKENNFNDPKNIFFANLSEIINNNFLEEKCLSTKKNYEEYNNFSTPNKITSSETILSTKLLGLSAGRAEGVLLNKEMLNKYTNKNQKVILYTDILSPNLVKYFNLISGIISASGSQLSHLAIVAREKKIPVVTGFSFNNEIKLGDYLKINGSVGEITKVQ